MICRGISPRESLHFFVLEENYMKCGECGEIRWFGDYGLHYCNKSGKVVTRDKECLEGKNDDKVFEKNITENQKDK